MHLDGAFVKPVLVPDDRLRPGQRATLYFPLRADESGSHRLQLVIAEHDADPVLRTGAPLLEIDLVVARGAGLDVRHRAYRGLFNLWHTELPIRVKALQRAFYRNKLAAGREEPSARTRTMSRFKEINRELAFMEKQVRRLRVASLPCYLAIDTTSKCNLECKMCFRGFADLDYNTTPDLPAAVLDRLITELFPTAITLNLSTIGEPLLSPYLDKILDACAAHHVYLSITTNGTVMRGDDFIRKLTSVLHHIEISVDSLQPERFKAYRSGASYQKVMQNTAKIGAIRRSLPDPKFNLGFSMTLFRDNMHEVPEAIRVIADLGGNFVKADIGVIFSKADWPQSVLSCPERYNDIYAIAQEQARTAGVKLMMRAPFTESDVTPAKYGLCDYLYVSAVVRSEGTLSPCYFGPAQLAMKDSFRAVWRGGGMRQLRRDHDGPRAHPLCKNCYVFTDGGSSVDSRRKQFLKNDAQTAVDAPSAAI
ncbi:MAG TPA: radical SAM protein [Vicinamibacterales bacterium]|nr:radical SAM protein [Vicinamibacterales bacterium]